jgi:hypothetical protein
VAQTGDAKAAQTALLDRCVLEARLEDRQVDAKELSSEVTSAIARRMGEVDPQADVQLDLNCPGCGRRWQALLDIENFFWTELNAWASKILSEVHVLASAYGWPETDILNLNPLRRQYYLDLVTG